MPIIWSGRLGPRSTGADRPACGELDAVAVADGLLTGAVRCYIAAMANPFEKRRRRNSIAVLAVLGGGVVVWWAGLLVSATVRKAFFADAALRGGWSGFILPDLLLLVGGGAAAMLAIRRDWPIVGPLLWLLLGGWAYALGWCLLMSVMTGQAWPAVGAMGLATLLIAALAVQWLPDDTAGRRLDPIKRTGRQIVAFWGGFLIAIPMTLLAIETAFGLRVGLFDGVIWRLAGLGLLLAASALGLYSGLYIAWHGRGTPLPLDPTPHLVTTGPYAIVRNPMAVAGIAQGVAVGLMLGSWLVLVYAALGGPVWHWLVRPWEERQLTKTFGERFTSYRQTVRCWLPGRTRSADTSIPPAKSDG